MINHRFLRIASFVLILIILTACGGTPASIVEPTSPPPPEPTITATPEPSLGSSRVNPVDGAVLVYVPEGDFLRGSDHQEASFVEKPQRSIYLDAFWIYQHPVTNAQFAAFVETSGYQTTAEDAGWSWAYDGDSSVEMEGAAWQSPAGPGSTIAGMDDYPVLHVSWFDAQAYCAWADGRMPTEAEWGKAARGDDGRDYPWGDSPVTGERANYCDVNCPFEWADADQDDGYLGPSPVGSYPAGASPYGAMDMVGNVWEWAADWFSEIYYEFSQEDNPQGSSSGETRAVRGGSWYNNASSMRVTFRHGFPPDLTIDMLGFRCVQPAGD